MTVPMPAPTRARTTEEMLSSLDLSGFDWEAYEGTYQGRALITRLSHIPNLLLSSTSKPTPQTLLLAHAALLRLVPRLKNETWDSALYLRSIHQLHTSSQKRSAGASGITSTATPSGSGNGGGTSAHAQDEEDTRMDLDTSLAAPAISIRGRSGGEESGMPDMDWVEDAKEHERKENGRLDVELRGYLSNLIKESIRLTYLAFAQLSVKVGNSQNAMKNFGAVREYSTSPQHHVDLGVGIVETLLAFNLPSSLPGHTSKLEATLDRLHPPLTRQPLGNNLEAASVTASDIRERRENEARSAAVRRSVVIRIRVAKGLVALYNREWTRAAVQLAAIGEEEGGLGDFEGKAISSSDLALIVAFSTLASADRYTIQEELLNKTSFKLHVEDSDNWIIELARAFVDARYGDVMGYLQRAEPILLLNPFLSAHCSTLIDLIRTRCIMQYVRPFSTIQIQTMSQAFDLPHERMLSLVEELVENGKIKGKIDLIDRVLVLSEPDWRGDAFHETLRVGKNSNQMTQSAILRMKLIEAGIIVDPRPKQSDKDKSIDLDAGDFSVELDEGIGEELGITLPPPTYPSAGAGEGDKVVEAGL